MAQLEKHKRNLMQEWLESDQELAPAHPRGLETLETRVKIRKPLVPGRLRLARPTQPILRPEPALVREAAPPPKLEEHGSQASSREHLLKLERLPQLRAAYPRSRRPTTGTPRRPAIVPSRLAARRAGGGRRVR